MPGPTKKPRTLRRKNIKRRTGNKAQSKQIMALSKQVSSLTKRSFVSVTTKWIRNNLSVDKLGLAVDESFAYVCPIPSAPCNPAGSNTGANPTLFTDNLVLQQYGKQIIFGVSQEAQTSNEVWHTGGRIQYQMISSEPSFSKYGLFLIQPRKRLADQLIKDRLLKSGTVLAPTLGSAGFLSDKLDYVVHSGAGGATNTCFGSQINPKYWKVIASKQIAFSHPRATGFSGNVNPSNTNPMRNSVTYSGSFKLPAGGLCKNSAVASQSGPALSASATGWEVEYGDQTNESACYLVCIGDGASADNETVTLGFMVNDYYKVAV